MNCFWPEVLYPRMAMLAESQFKIFLVFMALGLLVFTVFYLLTLQTALSQCSLEVRTMDPGKVWLCFVPLFNWYWQFVVVENLSKSLAGEFQKRRIVVEKNPGRAIGLAMCILAIFGVISHLLAIPAMICWIIYWVKIAGFSARLASEQPSPAGLDSDQKYYDTVAHELQNDDLKGGLKEAEVKAHSTRCLSCGAMSSALSEVCEKCGRPSF